MTKESCNAMSNNRITRHLNRMDSYFSPFEPDSQPSAQSPVPPAGFVVCPLHLAVAAAWQQEVYRRAYEDAVARTQVPRIYRRMFSSWN
jgi:hypothetical protein